MKQKFFKFLLTISVCLAAAILGGCSLLDIFTPKATPDIAPHLIEESEKESEPFRKIDDFQQSHIVGNTYFERMTSLYETVLKFKKPVFNENTADVKEIYDNALQVLNRYLKNDFNDYQKIHAIHDYLAYYIEYDSSLYEKYLDGDKNVSNKDPAFNLDGVFLQKKAVCDGIGKAFNFLCAVENIKSVQIKGEYIVSSEQSLAHAWNKVLLGKNWYNVDATMDKTMVSLNGKIVSILGHGYFLVSDKANAGNVFGHHIASTDAGLNPVNEETPELSYDAYSAADTDMTFNIGSEKVNMLVTSQQQLNEIFIKIRDAKRAVGKVELKLDFPGVTANRVGSFDAYLTESYDLVKNKDFKYNPNVGTRPYFQYPDGTLLLLFYV